MYDTHNSGFVHSVACFSTNGAACDRYNTCVVWHASQLLRLLWTQVLLLCIGCRLSAASIINKGGTVYRGSDEELLIEVFVDVHVGRGVQTQ